MERLTVADIEGAYAWPADREWVRAMMLHSLDGAVAGADGRSGSLSSPTDRSVLLEVRRLAEAVVIGAQTMRVERYRPMLAKPELADERAALGIATAPVLVIVSRSLDLDWTEPVFAESAITPIVITGLSSPERLREQAANAADLVVVDEHDVSVAAILDVLRKRGLRRIVCEGGPTLLAQFMEAGAVDELDLTIAPWLVGRTQEPFAPPAPPAIHFVPASMITDEGYVFMRYLRNDASTP